MTALLDQYTFTVRQQKLVLLPSKSVWAPEHATLMLADTHFGKAAVFRKSGIPVPAGTTHHMLQQISSLVNRLNAQSLIILGDFLHSSSPAQADFEDELMRWRQSQSHLQIVLLKGNHDRRNASFYSELNIEVCSEKTVMWNDLELCHDPRDGSKENFSLCGHIHPAIQIGSFKLPCFWLTRNQLVLPAFGEFTGVHKIQLNHDDSAYAICDHSLALVTSPRL